MRTPKAFEFIGAILFGCVMAVGCVQAQQSPITELDVVTADEYAVFASAMEEVSHGGSFVVLNTTAIHGDVKNLDRNLNSLNGDIDSEVRKDFIGRNQKPHPLSPMFPSNIRVTLLSEKERGAIFAGSLYQTGETQGKEDTGWRLFYHKYSNASGITSVSRVGFNHERDTALVYISNVRDFEVGGGWYLILVKKDGVWKVISRAQVWNS